MAGSIPLNVGGGGVTPAQCLTVLVIDRRVDVVGLSFEHEHFMRLCLWELCSRRIAWRIYADSSLHGLARIKQVDARASSCKGRHGDAAEVAHEVEITRSENFTAGWEMWAT